MFEDPVESHVFPFPVLPFIPLYEKLSACSAYAFISHFHFFIWIVPLPGILVL